MHKFLHIAASRFERLEDHVLKLICTPEWLHLGEPPINWPAEIREQFRFGNIRNGMRLYLAWLYRTVKPKVSKPQISAYYRNTTFRQFFFKQGDTLPFPDKTFAFSFAEHFFEHLWLEEVFSLLWELHRITSVGGILRISVPDADLRTYQSIEKVGFPAQNVPWSHHQKHKIRWNVYSLSAINSSGSWVRAISCPVL